MFGGCFWKKCFGQNGSYFTQTKIPVFLNLTYHSSVVFRVNFSDKSRVYEMIIYNFSVKLSVSNEY